MSAHPSRTPGVAELTGVHAPYWAHSPLSYRQTVETITDFLFRFASAMRQQQAYLADRIEHAEHDPRDPPHIVRLTVNRESAERHLRNLGLAIERAEAMSVLMRSTSKRQERKRERRK